MTREQQILELRKMVTRRVSDWLFYGGLCVAACCMVQGLRGMGHGWYIGAFFPMVIACVVRAVAVHQRNAVAALELKHEVPATVEIEIEETSESMRYYAQVHLVSGEAWRMEFIPLYWKPRAGTFPATARFAPAVEWPALMMLDQGIFYPTHKPKRLAS